jgi:peptidoglycan L-alanyl-D-glutamate endopeptidase CwlK
MAVTNRVIRTIAWDFSIIEGHRSVERQQEMFAKGLSRADGVKNKSKHNFLPSLAFDFMPFPGQLAGVDVWKDTQRFILIASVFLYVGKEMGINLRWGGDWNGNGTAKDQTLLDFPHIELVG